MIRASLTVRPQNWRTEERGLWAGSFGKEGLDGGTYLTRRTSGLNETGLPSSTSAVPQRSWTSDAGGGSSLSRVRKIAREVTCVDLMDGLGRKGWWEQFGDTASLLSVENAHGIRASGSPLPLRSDSFDTVTFVHAMRNFQFRSEVRSLLKESLRVLKPGGRVVVAESDSNMHSHEAYEAFYALRTELKWELRLPRAGELVRWLRESGFRKVSSEAHDWGLQYAPVYFPFDKTGLKGRERAWELARDLVIEKGESHPPVRVWTAVR